MACSGLGEAAQRRRGLFVGRFKIIVDKQVVASTQVLPCGNDVGLDRFHGDSEPVNLPVDAFDEHEHLVGQIATKRCGTVSDDSLPPGDAAENEGIVRNDDRQNRLFGVEADLNSARYTPGAQPF